MQDHEQDKKIQVRIPDEVFKGRYANMVHVQFGREEFILDFGVISSVRETGVITDRIFMNPAHVKRMVDVLSSQMKRYEEQFGIVIPSRQSNEIGFNTS